MSEQTQAPTQSEKKAPQSHAVQVQLVSFKLADENYALPILDVREVIRLAEITPVPNAPGFVEGVINLRGQIIPVVDLRRRFNLPPQEHGEDTRIMVTEIGGHVVGLVIDQVNQVIRVNADSIAPPPGLVSQGIGSEYLKGITYLEDKQMVILVDLHRAFSPTELGSIGGF